MVENEEADAPERKKQRKGALDGRHKAYATRVENELHLAYGFVIDTKAAAKKMKIEHDSVCWGVMCSKKKSHKGFWKSNCDMPGCEGHGTFESKLHQAALKQRDAFKALDTQDKSIFKGNPFRRPAV